MRRTKGFILDICFMWILHHYAGIVSTKFLCVDRLGAGERALDPQTGLHIGGKVLIIV